MYVTEGIVTAVEPVAPGLWRATVCRGGAARPALAYTPPLPSPVPGDRVVLNTVGVDLQLGTGGYDIIMHIIGRQNTDALPWGHIIKMRYTPWQLAVPAVEEEASPHHDLMREAYFAPGLPAAVVALHSQLAPAAAGLRLALGSDARLVFVMTDDAALPLALSETVPRLLRLGLLNATVTAGHAFGGDVEAVTVFSGLLAARHVLQAAAVVVGPGPGMPGTGTPFGTPAVHVGHYVDAIRILEATPVVAPRLAFGDPRPRHRGVSHHTLTALGRVASKPGIVALPDLAADKAALVWGQLERAGLTRRHRIVVEPRAAAALDFLTDLGVPLRSMGRSPQDDGALFLAGAAAGWVAGELGRKDK